MSSLEPAPNQAQRPVFIGLSQVLSGLLLASVVFAAFAAYAFLVSATYRSSALFAVDVPAGASITLPEPLDAARRVREAVLDRGLLDGLARARADSPDPEARARAARQVRNALEVDTSDGKTFSISYSDSDRFRAQRACQELARHAVERAPRSLSPERSPEEQALDLRRRQSTQELAAFLATHPDLAASAAPPAQPPLGNVEAADTALVAMNSERARLAQLAREMEKRPSDNPYVEPSDRVLDPLTVKRRIAELDTAILARHLALQPKSTPPTAKPSPELGAEFTRLVKAIADVGATQVKSIASPTLLARLVTDASIPDSPVEPNRPRLLAVGALMAFGLGSLWAIAQSALARPAGRPERGGSRDSNRTLRSSAPAPVRSNRARPSPSPDRPALGQRSGSQASPPERLESGSAGRIFLLDAGLPNKGPDPAWNAARLGVPGFAVVRAGRDEALPFGATHPSTDKDPPPRPIEVSQIVRPTERPRLGPRSATSKVTMPLGSLVPEGPWSDLARPSPPPPDRTTDRPAERNSDRAAGRTSDRAADRTSDRAAGRTSDRAADRTSDRAAGRTSDRAPDTYRSPVPPLSPLPQTAGRPIQPRTGVTPVPPRQPGLTPAPQPGPTPAPQPHTSPTPAPRTQTGLTPAPRPQISLTPAPTNRTPVPNSDTSYSYVIAAGSTETTPAPTSSPGGARVKIVGAPANWRPDLGLLPESRRSLCEKLYPFAVERCFVLVVVGAVDPGENKSRVAAELALALAETGHPRVLVMEGDFHRPNVHRWMHVSMPVGAGFSQQMNARIHSGEAHRWRVVECTKSLHVLAEGMMRSPGLLLSQQFDQTMHDLRTYYDFIVIDGPTTSLDVDSRAIDAVTDGLVIVCPPERPKVAKHVHALFSEKRFNVSVPG